MREALVEIFAFKYKLVTMDWKKAVFNIDTLEIDQLWSDLRLEWMEWKDVCKKSYVSLFPLLSASVDAPDVSVLCAI